MQRGGIQGNKTRIDYGDKNLKDLQEPIGFNESVRIINDVLEKEYPAISKGLKVDRGDGIITSMLLQDKLNKKFEKNITKNWDDEQNKRLDDYYDTVAKYNAKRAEDMKMHNPERAQLLPAEVFNSLRAFKLDSFPIDNNGRLLMSPDLSDQVVTVGAKKYYAFNKKGDLNVLRVPVLFHKISKLSLFDGMKARHVKQIPEFKVLRSYILSRGNNAKFKRDLERIARYKQSLTDPNKLVNRILGKMDKISIKAGPLRNSEYNKFIASTDQKSVEELGNILSKENIVKVAPYPKKLKSYFKKYLTEGKLSNLGKSKFAEFVQIYPKSIDKDYNI